MNKRVNLETYTQDIFDSGYYVGVMKIAMPVRIITTVGVREF